jgi:carbonic anhydrase
MKKKDLLYFFILIWVIFSFPSCSFKESKIKWQKPLERLMQGNERYVNNQSIHPNQSEERRKTIAETHSPYAIIVGCSDSRVSPEIIFDQGLGDLFVVRVAGNVIGSLELESIEYAALQLHSAIILILGHENCGAVDAVIKNNTQGMKDLAKLIEPSVQNAKKSPTNNFLEKAIKTNALNMKKFLEKNPHIQKLIQDKNIEVHAAYYHLKTGIVESLDEDLVPHS